MAWTRGTAKRQRLTSAVDFILVNIDILSQLAAFLEASDLCQVKATCKGLGSGNDDAAVNGLSMVDDSARQIYEDASVEEKATLPHKEGEGWIELYHHLMMLRARLTFDQLVGVCVEFREGDETVVQARRVDHMMSRSQAICGNHIMRAGKHWATFASSLDFDSCQTVGVIRPLPGWEKKGLEAFNPALSASHHHDLLQERTDRWEGDVHCCIFGMLSGICVWSDWREGNLDVASWEATNEYDKFCTTLGMLLDLGNGTLSLYQNGQRLGTLKDGLAGEYCWTAGFWGKGDVSIQRGYLTETEA